jgi:hypothetical protein
MPQNGRAAQSDSQSQLVLWRWRGIARMPFLIGMWDAQRGCISRAPREGTSSADPLPRALVASAGFDPGDPIFLAYNARASSVLRAQPPNTRDCLKENSPTSATIVPARNRPGFECEAGKRGECAAKPYYHQRSANADRAAPAPSPKSRESTTKLPLTLM